MDQEANELAQATLEATMAANRRLAAYKEVLDYFDIDPEDNTYSGGEDAGSYISGEAQIERFCVLKKGGEWTYTYCHDKTIEEAKARSMRDINDDVFAEFPVAIIDLDTGEKWTPKISVSWSLEADEKVRGK